MPNQNRINKVLKNIAADIKKWDQKTYANIDYNDPKPENNYCGAIFCMAGHGSLAAGYHPGVHLDDEGKVAGFSTYWFKEPLTDVGLMTNAELDELGRVPFDIAAEYFDIDTWTADSLFEGQGAYFNPGLDGLDSYRQYVDNNLEGASNYRSNRNDDDD